MPSLRKHSRAATRQSKSRQSFNSSHRDYLPFFWLASIGFRGAGWSLLMLDEQEHNSERGDMPHSTRDLQCHHSRPSRVHHSHASSVHRTMMEGSTARSRLRSVRMAASGTARGGHGFYVGCRGLRHLLCPEQARRHQTQQMARSVGRVTTPSATDGVPRIIKSWKIGTAL